MQPKNPFDWMLSEALDQLTRGERLRQQFGRQEACWEPPIDVLETEHELLILVAAYRLVAAKTTAGGQVDASAAKAHGALPS